MGVGGPENEFRGFGDRLVWTPCGTAFKANLRRGVRGRRRCFLQAPSDGRASEERRRWIYPRERTNDRFYT